MRGRFTVVLIITMFFILVFSILITYNTVSTGEKMLDSSLFSKIIPLLESNPEALKEIELYRAFSANRAIDITRRSLYLYSVVIVFMTLIFLMFTFQVTKPLLRLTETMKRLNRMDKISPGNVNTVLKERGALEVRLLTRSFNEMLENLKGYEAIIGDRGRYLGWREISRVIVHELNNLISPVETYSGYLYERLAPEMKEERETLYFILLKLEEMKHILMSLKDISHLPEPSESFFRLEELFGEISYDYPGIRLEHGGKGIEVLADRFLFSQIIRNLVKNATESGEDGEPVEVTLSAEERKGALDIIVSDNGRGIDEEVLEKVFQPGFSTKEGNLGIGLSVVKILAEAMGLAVSVESIKGRGSSFKVTIPAERYRNENTGSR